jgi:hypothetical protein
MGGALSGEGKPDQSRLRWAEAEAALEKQLKAIAKAPPKPTDKPKKRCT